MSLVDDVVRLRTVFGSPQVLHCDLDDARVKRAFDKPNHSARIEHASISIICGTQRSEERLAIEIKAGFTISTDEVYVFEDRFLSTPSERVTLFFEGKQLHTALRCVMQVGAQ